MEQDYTVNKLIQLIYGECDLCDRLELEYAIKNDTKYSKEYAMLRASYKALPGVKFSPSKQSLNRIITFAGKSLSATA